MTAEEFNVDEVQIGRILHFVTYNRDRPQCRPAIVVEDWPNQGKPGYANMIVFPDGSNDGKYGVDDHKHGYSQRTGEPRIGGPSNVARANTDIANVPLLTRWETSVLPNHAVKAVRSWHWPRECSKLHAAMEPFKSEDGIIHHNHEESVNDPHNCPACQRQVRVEKES